LAFSLCAVHGFVCVGYDRFGVADVPVSEGDTDACGQHDRVRFDLEGDRDVCCEALGELGRVLGLTGAAAQAQDGKFVASEASGGITGAHGGKQSSAYRSEDQVAGGVTMAVVYGFKAVEIEEQDGYR
jgi:hypothetical protein